ncbi:MAG: 2-phospho-L-lactate transferase [Gammaproteobacteria bacterium]|nr:2-phospho-L-lactate transferase [Gammaproteobacteria bacterium]
MIIALSGGIGGAKLARGLYRVLPADELTVVVNTGDDFEHLGLHIAPDLDTLVYTLAGCNNPDTGWGRAGETWTFMRVLAGIGGESWFNLGDGDLALHVERTRRLRAGERLATFTEDVRRRFGVHARVLPMSDDPVRTLVATDAGVLAFQHYFVRERCVPRVTGFEFAGAGAARPCAEVLAALRDRSLEAVVLCPSNPFVSIDPILSVPGIRAALAGCAAPVVAVSPIVGGDAVKGPTAKMMRELGLPVRAAAVAARYADFIDGFVLDERDAEEAGGIAMPVSISDTLMRSDVDRERLAGAVLGFVRTLGATR